MSSPVSIIITVNSPGEVSGWLKPFVKALKQVSWKTSITVFVPPCTFASGSECKVIRAMPEVDLVVEPLQVLQFILFRKTPFNFHPTSSGVVLFLGGDLTWAAWIAKRLHFPAIAYTEGFANMIGDFSFFAQPYHKMVQRLINQGIPEKKIRLVGNLMLDAVHPNSNKNELQEVLKLGERPLLLLMPGSRPSHFEYMVPFLLDVVMQVKDTVPEVEPVFSISPFIDDSKLETTLTSPYAKLWGLAGSFIPGQEVAPGVSSFTNPGLIRTESGVSIRVFRGRQYDLMAVANMAISLPGTNTMELSFMGVPLIVTIPMIYPERIPLEGIPGLVGNIPVFGKLLKRWLIPKMLAKIKYTAWPNLLAQEDVVPEMRGAITAAQVSCKIVELLKNKEWLCLTSQRLKNLAGENGAAFQLVKVLEDALDLHFKNWRKGV